MKKSKTKSNKSISQRIAEEMEKNLGPPSRIFKVKMKHTKAVQKLVKQIEDAHKNAKSSKLKFG